MSHIRSFQKLPDTAKEKILEWINRWIKKCEESYETMAKDPTDIEGIVYDVKREFYDECDAYSLKIYEICDKYGFEWTAFRMTSASISIGAMHTPIEDIELPNRVKDVLNKFKEKYFNKGDKK